MDGPFLSEDIRHMASPRARIKVRGAKYALFLAGSRASEFPVGHGRP